MRLIAVQEVALTGIMHVSLRLVLMQAVAEAHALRCSGTDGLDRGRLRSHHLS